MTLLNYFEFDELIQDVQACRLCPEMEGCTRVLSWANGQHDADIMFIAEAPGRLGADRTAIPLHGDKTGDNFEHLLELAGLSRREIFVTNAVLCNPKDEKGNNAPPSRAALRNCAANLKRQIDITKPRLVVTLGAAALEATRAIAEHGLTLSTGVRTANSWYDRVLVPLYHPGARAMIHRNFITQTSDYYFVGETYRRLRQPAARRAGIRNAGSDGWGLVQFILTWLGECSLFRLHKTMYLIDWKVMGLTGERATDFLYIRQKDGPYCVELGSRWFRRFEPDLTCVRQNGGISLRWTRGSLFGASPSLAPRVREIAEGVLEQIASLSDGELKVKSYLTAPMKARLRAERTGVGQLNRPIL